MQPISTYSFDEYIRKEKIDFPNDTLSSKYSAVSNTRLIGIQIKFLLQLKACLSVLHVTSFIIWAQIKIIHLPKLTASFFFRHYV